MRIEFKYLATRSGKAIVLSVEDRRYVFNVFEGFQRYCTEQCVKLSKVSSVFLLSEDSIPPLVGACMTLRDMGREDLNVVCGPRLRRIMESANSFAKRMGMRIEYLEDYEDEFVHVEPIHTRVGDVGGSRERMETSYVLTFSPIRGKFLVEMVPKEIPRNLYSELSKKKLVEYGGRVYDGDEYVESDVVIGSIGMVYSSCSYEEVWDMIKDRGLRYIFCFQEGMARFLSTLFEGDLFLLGDSSFVEYECLYEIQVELNRVCSDFLVPLSLPSTGNRMDLDVRYLQDCDTLVYDRDARLFGVTRREHREHVEGARDTKPGSVLFLGTGSAIPSKYRNVSAVLYESTDTAVMMDCGEDVLFQIHRAYGNLDVLRKLTVIFISHSHADHVLGIVSVLRMVRHRIKVFGPSGVRLFIEQFGVGDWEFVETDRAKVLERKFNNDIRTRDRGGCQDGDRGVGEYVLTFDCSPRVTICGVEHNIDSCGIRIHDGNMSLSYSGDCRPSVLFGMMSSGADVMIHEATFASDQYEKAVQKKHSTVEEAVKIFRLSRSRRLLLTHFSQRYAKGVVPDGCWIPCVDLFRYVIGSEYPADEVRRCYERLEIEE